MFVVYGWMYVCVYVFLFLYTGFYVNLIQYRTTGWYFAMCVCGITACTIYDKILNYLPEFGRFCLDLNWFVNVLINRYNSIKDGKFYFFDLGEKTYIDATFYGNESRFGNHCCKPNAVGEKWIVNENGRAHIHVGLFAKRRIQPVGKI